ncbi:phosphoglycerate mutase [Ramlibacter sp. H39-3-26]|uniref:phosphoglycerate mutase n=1 Tax=Curvibacter soli TaxID=3031331 RepID=UPI0023DC6E16|nr:phosphoglycerate mutase [Ramlibacter sp. H39-3-26]MDF1483889.1 phosphoglycerate mutase [Ramlibacter sp. H39-3-26]
MPDPCHLLIPGAVLPPGPDGVASLAPELPELPALRQLLRVLAPGERIALDEDSPAMPHEVAVARAMGLPGAPGHTPWAALETRTAGQPCAWIKACHWQMGMDHLVMAGPGALTLDTAASDTLLAAMQPYFAEDGIALRASAMPGAWLAVGEPLRRLRCVSIDRVAGRDVKPWITGPQADRSPAALLLQRLHSEMQMLFYTLPLNDERMRQGLLPVNAFWVVGAGALDALPPARPGFKVERRLYAAAAEPAARAQAWRAVDADSCAWLLAQSRQGAPVRLTLCGERAAQSFDTPPAAGWWQRLKTRISPQRNTDLLHTL